MTTDAAILRVMEIERFAIHDGPGIRTVVFLQGCPLRCPWCANPESWAERPVLLHDKKKCAGCGDCAAACGLGAVRFAPGKKPEFSRELCVGCGGCARRCPAGALSVCGKAMRTGEVLEAVLRDGGYYRNSGGGITVSGGEPFAQPEGLLSLLRAAKAAGLNTAAETSAAAKKDDFRAAEPYIDCYLLDFKHADPARLAEVTGAKSDLIFANMEWLAEHCPQKVTARVPVIPGFNHSASAIRGILRRTAELGFKTAHLLPYHTLGAEKYARLGIPYPWPHTEMLQKRDLILWKRIGEALGLGMRLGG